jgi:hypothetical protein
MMVSYCVTAGGPAGVSRSGPLSREAGGRGHTTVVRGSSWPRPLPPGVATSELPRTSWLFSSSKLASAAPARRCDRLRSRQICRDRCQAGLGRSRQALRPPPSQTLPGPRLDPRPARGAPKPKAFGVSRPSAGRRTRCPASAWGSRAAPGVSCITSAVATGKNRDCSAGSESGRRLGHRKSLVRLGLSLSWRPGFLRRSRGPRCACQPPRPSRAGPGKVR